MLRNVTFLGASVWFVFAAQADAQRNNQFEWFSTLYAGDWFAQSASGHLVELGVRRMSGGSALLETFRVDGREVSVTLYHADHDRLIATHYCPQGNQVRLTSNRAARSRSDPFAFVFDSATDVEKGEAVWHGLRLVRSGNAIRRLESYLLSDGSIEETELLFRPARRSKRAPDSRCDSP